MLQELLGDFFVDADALEKKELLGEGVMLGESDMRECV